MTASFEDDPRDSRATSTRNLQLHHQFWEQLVQDHDSDNRRHHELVYASMSTLITATALEWVAREFGRDRADELSWVLHQYVANGEDYEGLFEEFPEFADTSITLVETPKEPAQ